MALNQPGPGSCSPGVLKVALGLMALCLAGYILGPPLYWHFMEGLAAVSRSSSSASCPPCLCDCSSQPLLTIPQGLSNTSFADCAKRDPEASEDTEKNFVELLSEELKLRKASALESQRRADLALLEAKKMTSQYQKEADKCNSGMETCEEAREKAEAALLAQKRETETWELRARQRGWKAGVAKSRTQSQGNVQAV
uniref:Plant/T7A14-6 protein n=1 Tax=Davidia involucrata TaxID=16924 RepID=A0A5B7AS12_DAVIN